ncbi:bifunctional 4-hydroxy-4-methyl-2-oxoglutarate aldolase/oxaloacetate decarboxylase KNAG_0L00850 [Huiozyma naganishii CBS 8797]|uniref:RraA-like protein n=1 Tax=Huiozyma naganishii (strain ATCC MYA-139 / BCRC 22969 / CBS 8797 / KCTC 17520 / NBRC 10181 / NCYC 3082 / Yp74L-3) TaxID=1071383 RepID=J7SB35_HUIN7|nr:hypothetical protein KNAG_0L00850 [Kazachstania naganishii CBS 8797]CCK72706.1 hypothetical protein KNAG_0L00850 [Kazachstania naganishii CBS 8797]
MEDDAACQELAEFTTCDISDGLLNLYDIPTGGYFPNLVQRSKSGSDKTTVGKAYTVLFAPVDDPRDTVNFIDEVPAGSVMVIALTPPLQRDVAPYVKPTVAVFGGLMATRAQHQACRGCIVFGRVRDMSEFRDLSFPVHSYGVGACASKLTVKPVAVNVDLDMLCSDSAVQTIKPNDLIAADEHGVVSVPHALVDTSKLIRYIRKSVEVDEQVAADIIDGAPAKESQKQRRAVLRDYL